MPPRHGFLLSSVAACALIASAQASSAAEPRATFEICDTTADYGDLSNRLRQAIGEASGNELATTARRNTSAEKAIELATDLLRTEGYYGGYVVMQEGPSAQKPPRLCIHPGTQFTIENSSIRWSNVVRPQRPGGANSGGTRVPGAPSAQTTVAAAPPVRVDDGLNEARDVVGNANKAIELDGDPALATELIAAEGRIIRSLREDGFADARALPRQIHVVHPDTSSPDYVPDGTTTGGDGTPATPAEGEVVPTLGNAEIAGLADALHSELSPSTPPLQTAERVDALPALPTAPAATGTDTTSPTDTTATIPSVQSDVSPSQLYAGHSGNVVIPFYDIDAGELVRLSEVVRLLNPMQNTSRTEQEEEDTEDSEEVRLAADGTPITEQRDEAERQEARENARGTRTRIQFLQSLVSWKEGQAFSPDLLTQLEKDLSDTGVYNSVAVALESLPRFRSGNPTTMGVTVDTDNPEAQDSPHREVQVNLVDRDRYLLETGLSYATQDGVGVDIARTEFNRFGRADTLRYLLRLADIDSRIGAEWSRPHFHKRGRTISASGFIVNEITDAYERQAVTFDTDLSERRGEKWWASVGLGIDAGRYAEVRYDPVTQQALDLDRDLAMLTVRGALRTDNSNNPLDPTSGWRASLSVQPTAVAGEDTVFFLRTVADASAYYGLGEEDATILAGRVKIGSIIGGDELIIPSSRLMYSGGGGSVRGYSYQSINPRLPDNTPRGGLGLFEASMEVRRDIRDNWQAVAFVDAGAVGFQSTPNLTNMRYGAGVGVRYKLPFGPIRADIAFPLNKREGDSEFQLYISIGQSF